MTLQEMKQDWIEKRERYLDRKNGYKTGHKAAMTRAYNNMRFAYFSEIHKGDPTDNREFIEFKKG